MSHGELDPRQQLSRCNFQGAWRQQARPLHFRTLTLKTPDDSALARCLAKVRGWPHLSIPQRPASLREVQIKEASLLAGVFRELHLWQ